MVNQFFKFEVLETGWSNIGRLRGREKLDVEAHSLLGKIRAGIGSLEKPAYVKNSELVYVAVNRAYASLFGLQPDQFIDQATLATNVIMERLDLADRERRCLVFGEDQLALYADSSGAGRFQVEIERFADENDDFFIYGVFEPQIEQVDKAEGDNQPAVMPANQGSGAKEERTDLDGPVPENVLETIDVGIIVYDRDDALIYVNEKMQEFYSGLIGRLTPGSTRRQFMERVYDCAALAGIPSGQKARDAWVGSHMRQHAAPYSSALEQSADGRWLKAINRRMKDGRLLSIRIDVTDMKERELLLERKVNEVERYRTVLNALPVTDDTSTRRHDGTGPGRSRLRPLPVNVEGARILVIGDNEVNRTLIAEQLLEWNFDAVAVESGDDGLAVLEAAHESGIDVDAIILDCQMPGANGADVARRIRADRRFGKVSIIFLSSMDIAGDEHVFAELDVAAQLMKPTRAMLLPETLVNVVSAARSPFDHVLVGGGGAAMTAKSGMKEREAVSTAAIHPIQARWPEPVAQAELDVLIAEDNEVDQIVFRQILEGAGIRFRIVENGHLAFQAWQVEQPSIILMDVSMPVMNGLETSMRIRRMERATGAHVPIIGVTAHVLDNARDMCLKAGMDDFLSKPISPGRLEGKIRHWIKAGKEQGQGAH